jgi:Bacterial Ig-like domain (group 3)/FG-GAP-like repeat/FG-GAP repeat/Beta-propeller repeat/NHL repeat
MSDMVIITTLHLPGAVRDRIASRRLARLVVVALFFLALGQAGLRPAPAHAQTAVSEKGPSAQSHPAQYALGPATPTVVATYGGLPLSFEANQGQADQRVKFLARGQGYGFYLTANEAVLALSRPLPRADRAKMQKIAHWRMLWPFLSAAQRRRLAKMSASLLGTDTLRMELKGANSQAQVSGSDELPGTTNYFLGNDPARWRTHVPTFAKVHYTGVYPGIDLIYYGNQRRLEYDFVVAPHANPRQVELHFSGAQQPRLDDLGNLHISGNNGEVAFEKPVIYQDEKGQQVPVKGQYVLSANHTVGFKVGKYDHSKVLVIDPTLSYATYLGGSTEDAGTAIAVDAAGSIYVVGFTADADFPVTTGAFQTTNTMDNLVGFVAKLNAAGSALVYATYLGGAANNAVVSGTDAYGIAVDKAGSAYICGETYSSDFPVTTGAFQTQNKGFANGAQNAFISKLSPDGSALSYSTYLGGSGLATSIDDTSFFEGDSPLRMTVDTAGSAYVVGTAFSTDFPTTTGAYQRSNKAAANFASNAFVAKLNPNGSSLVYSTYLGGSGVSPGSLPIDDGEGGGERGYGIAVDTAGEAYVTGYTFSADFPVTTNGYQQVNHGTANVAANAFVSKLNAGGTGLVASTYLGGTGRTAGENGDLDVSDNGDDGIGVALDASGDAYVIGVTTSTDFPTSKGAYQTTNKAAANLATNVFVSKLNPTLSTLMYSTYLGGSGIASPTAGDVGLGDFGTGIAIDKAGDAYVTGATESRNFPVTSDAFQSGPRSAQTVDSGFFTEVNPSGSALQYSTYLGGSGAGAYGGTDFSFFEGDFFYDIALDGSDNAYLTGYAYSYDFPVTKNGLQTVNNAGGGPGGNSFIAKFGATAGATFLPTTTTLSSTTVGANITFTAVVKPVTGTGVPTGTVNFYVNSVKATTVTLDQTGTVTYTTDQLTDSLNDVIAAYSGDATYGASGSSLGQSPPSGLPATTLTLSANPTSSVVGEKVTLTATLAPFNGDGFTTDGETVTFLNGGTAIGTGTLSGGVATFSTSALPAGVDILTASYPGDTNLAPSVSQPLNYTVSQPTTTTTLAITAGGTTVTTVASGTAVTLIATVTTGDTPVNPGRVIFCDATATRCEDSAVLGTAQLTSAGKATLKFVPGIGSHSYKAVFAGTTGNTTSTSSAQALTVTGLYSTKTALAETGEPGNYTLTGTVVGTGSANLSPAGTLSFLDTTNNNASLGTATLGAGVPGLSFRTVSSAATLDYPQSVAVGDFNGDGKPDLAVPNTGVSDSPGNGVLIFLGNGDGTFKQSPVVLQTGSSPAFIISGDFNNDGNVDLAVGNAGDDSMNVFLGNGDGTFTSAPSPDPGGQPQGIVLGDFNQDGNADLAVLTNLGVTILLGKGDGSFTAPAPISAVNLRGIAVADFNGDGKPDLAATVFPSNQVVLYLGNGDGTFNAAPTTTPTGIQPEAIVTGDFNNDGKADLAVGNQGDSTVTIMLNNGDGTFSTSLAASASGDPVGLVVADFNGDGNTDLAVSSTPSNAATFAEVLLGNGDGTFTKPSIAAVTGVGLGLGDFNSDGVPDIAAHDFTSKLFVGITQRTQTATATLANAAVTAPPAGGHSVVANYPGNTNFGSSTSTPVTLTPASPVNPPTITSLNPNAVYAGSGDTVVTITGTNFVSGAVVSVNGTNQPATFVSATELTTTLTVAHLSTAGTLTLTVVNPDGGTSNAAAFTVLQLPLELTPANLAFGDQTVGTPSAPQVVTVTNSTTAAITITTITLDLGLNPGDFAQTNNCPTTLAASANCKITITFAPNGVGPKSAGLLVSDNTSLPNEAVGLTGAGTGGILQVNPGNLKTIAGNGTAGYAGDGGAATAAELNDPDGVNFDAQGNLYIADLVNNVIRKVDTAGNITTVAGNGKAGFSGDGGPATAAELNGPFGVTPDSAGNLYIQDTLNARIRKVDTTGTITTIAGNGTFGFSGDGGPATAAEVAEVQGARFDTAGNLYVPQCGPAAIRKIDTTGTITTVAGNGTDGFTGDGGPATSAQLNCPSGVAIDAAGELFIADYLNNRIRKVGANGIITTIAGNGTPGFTGDGGPALSAEINLPNDVDLDAAGDVYIADSGNNRLRKIGTTGVITTVAGGLNNAGSAGINAPSALALGKAGNLYFSDSGNNAVREVFPAGALSFPPTPVGTAATPQTVTLSNIGNVAVEIASGESFALSGNAADFSLIGGTCLASPATLAPQGGSCTLEIGFKPTATGTRNLTVSVTDNAVFSPQSFQISGIGKSTSLPAVVLTTISPVGATAGAGNTTITATGANFTATSVVNFNTTPLTTTFVSATQLTAVVPAALLATVGTAAVTVTDSASESSSEPAVFTIVPSGLSVTFSGPSTTPPGEQPPLTFQLNQPYPVDLAGTMTLTFAPDPGNPANPQVQFASGGTTFNFTLPANTTTTPAVMVQVGTISGTITITLQLTAAGVNVTPANVAPITIVVPKVAPTISAVSMSVSGNTLTVLTTGYSTTREVQSATFSFTPANGATLAQKTVIVPSATLFSAWYTTPGSAQYGSAFTYSQQFTLSGPASSVASVSVTLTNTVGTSSGVSSQ